MSQNVLLMCARCFQNFSKVFNNFWKVFKNGGDWNVKTLECETKFCQRWWIQASATRSPRIGVLHIRSLWLLYFVQRRGYLVGRTSWDQQHAHNKGMCTQFPGYGCNVPWVMVGFNQAARWVVVILHIVVYCVCPVHVEIMWGIGVQVFVVLCARSLAWIGSPCGCDNPIWELFHSRGILPNLKRLPHNVRKVH